MFMIGKSHSDRLLFRNYVFIQLYQELNCFTPSVDSSKNPVERGGEEGTLEACKIPFLVNSDFDGVENRHNLTPIQNNEKGRSRDFPFGASILVHESANFFCKKNRY